MMTLLLSCLTFAVFGTRGDLPASAQDKEEEFSWDCPGMGYLPYRRELLVSTDQLARMIEEGAAVVVHVGSDERATRVGYAEGHLPGARLLRWSDLWPAAGGCRLGSHLDVFRALGITSGDRVVFYDTGVGIEAAAAFVALDGLGLADHAALLDGQWSKWVLEGRPLSVNSGAPSPAPDLEAGPSTIRVDSEEWKILLGRARESAKSLTLIDARRRPQFPKPPPGSYRPARMSWLECLASVNCPVLLPEGELRRRWCGLPATQEHLLVIGARHWPEAAPVYFCAKLLGYSARILDGCLERAEPEEGDLRAAP